MPVPYYQVFKLQSHDPRIIVGQLMNMNFAEVPVVITVDHLAQNQLDCLKTIEDFFIKHPTPNLPYSCYIIADCPEYTGQLYLVKNRNQLPQFFNKKQKALTSKENTYLNKIELKQENFKNLVSSEYVNAFSEYAIGHKQIANKQNFLVYLEKINKGLREYYGQEK